MISRVAVVLLNALILIGSEFIVIAVAYQSQQKPSGKDQVRLKTDLFEVRAVVTDARGKPVDSLRKEDFELLENNRPQTISFFSIEHPVSDAKSQPPSIKDNASTTSANRAGAAPGRTIVLFVDMTYNAPAQAQSDFGMVMQLSLSRGEQTVYQGQWQPIAPLVVKKDGIGIQIGGQFKLSLQPGVYALVIAVKDSRSRRPVQETVAFAVEP